MVRKSSSIPHTSHPKSKLLNGPAQQRWWAINPHWPSSSTFHNCRLIEKLNDRLWKIHNDTISPLPSYLSYVNKTISKFVQQLIPFPDHFPSIAICHLAHSQQVTIPIVVECNNFSPLLHAK